MWSEDVKGDLNRAVSFGWKFSFICTALFLLPIISPKVIAPIFGVFTFVALWLAAPGEIAADIATGLLYQRLHGGPPYVYFPVMTVFNFLFYAALSFPFFLLMRVLNKKS